MSKRLLTKAIIAVLVVVFAAFKGLVEPATEISSAEAGKFIPARVVKVTDGDTIQVEIEGRTEKVRLIGVDTPETVHPTKKVEAIGPEASAYTKQLLGRNLWLELDVGERDKYGRLLAYVWLEKPEAINIDEISEKMFNGKLLAEGYGRLMTIQPNVRYVAYFTKIQTQARENQKGIWKDYKI